jgi:hypothetical protein
MSTDVVDLRKGDRFHVVEPITGSFGAAEIAILNLSVTGAQISHPQPLRIGTRAKLWFKRGDITIATQAHIVWSHLVTAGGAMVYRSGIRLEASDAQFAMAINTFLRSGIIRQDMESLEKKRARLAERELQRKSQVRNIPTSEPIT